MTRTEQTLTHAREIAFRADPEASPDLVLEVFRQLCAEQNERRYADLGDDEVLH